VFFKEFFNAVYRFLISLKLAVLIFILLAILTAIGTFVESKYDQEIANSLVYSSFWMSFIMILLAVNLTMVLIDRWPWKLRQIPFVLAHFGILTLMMGFVFTNNFGVDATLQFEEGESSSRMSLADMEIKLYGSYDAEKFSLLYEKDVDFFTLKPSEEDPFEIQSDGQIFQVKKYYPYAVGNQSLKPIKQGGSPALRFLLSGSRANVVEWLEMEFGSQTFKKTFGLATITLTLDELYKSSHKRELVLYVKEDRLFYSIGGAKKTELKVGDVFSTGWMDLEFRLLEFYPKAQREYVFTPRKKNSDQTVKAIWVEHEGESFWLGQNSHIKFFKKDRVYALSYLNKTKQLPFELKLLDFRIKNYQGSDKAMSYESEVNLIDKDRLYRGSFGKQDKKETHEILVKGREKNLNEGLATETGSGSYDELDEGIESELDSKKLENPRVLISMNEPLKYRGWTLYQSSFIAPENEGENYQSILSVNYDPGRVLKYVGSAWTILGVILLFSRRRLLKLLKK